jgi:hypothetical protein
MTKFSLPPKAWYTIDDVCNRWETDRSTILDYVWEQGILRPGFDRSKLERKGARLLPLVPDPNISFSSEDVFFISIEECYEVPRAKREETKTELEGCVFATIYESFDGTKFRCSDGKLLVELAFRIEDFMFPFAELQRFEGTFFSQETSLSAGPKQIETLLQIIGGLTSRLAALGGENFRKGDGAPNISQIATLTKSSIGEESPSHSTIRNHIAKGMEYISGNRDKE